MMDSGYDIKSASDEIQTWLILDIDNEPSVYHEDVIVILGRDVMMQDLYYLNPGNILGRLAIDIIKKRNLEYIQQCIEKSFTLKENKTLAEQDNYTS